MPRRKQDCPKRMKWEGGEGGEEGPAPDSPGSKLAGDDASSSGATSPSSAVAAESPALQEDGAVTAPASPVTSPSPVVPAEHQDTDEPEEAIPMLQDPLAVRDIGGLGSRCPSRESRGSSVPPRCPSRDSVSSERGRLSGAPTPAVMVPPLQPPQQPAAAISPVAVTLPASIPPAALLPSHSAAIAAYLGVAAAAAAQHPHHRLLMTSPVLPRSPLVSSSSSPPILPLGTAATASVISPPPPPLRSPMETDSSAVLDFSTKKSSGKTPTGELDSESVLNLSKPTTPVLPAESQLNSPLDLSVSSRKRGLDDCVSPSVSALSPGSHPPSRKNSRLSAEFKPAVVSPWTSPVAASHFPYFAAAAMAAASVSSLSPKNNTSHGGESSNPLWNGKLKMQHDKPGAGPHFVPTPSDATKALEKMSELSKLGGEDLFRPAMNSGVVSGGASNSGSGSSRHSAWQSHWLNKGAEQAKDVLKCVWCKQSFPSLAAMTAHMKEAKHCGVNVPAPPPTIQPPPPPPPPPQSQPPTSTPSGNSGSSSGGPPGSMTGPPNSKPTAADLNLLIKETMPLPRKLVRGQDVWLGKGAEQTRQILKCMWCGQSFRSLAEMTNHMQQTQHYTNIISQEQIISWKSSDDSKAGGGSGPGGGGAPGGGAGGGGASSHVSAVLTCKVCDQAFSSLKELSNHMVKNSHYKEHIMRSITESGGRRRQTREKRKKSLPVRKLLELERAQHELKNGEGAAAGMMVGGKLGVRDPTASAAGRITCEKCGDKIETSIFVDHIRQCVGGNMGSNQRNLLKSALLSSNLLPQEATSIVMSQHLAERGSDGRKSIGEERHHRSPSLATDLTTTPTSGVKESTSTPSGGESSSSPSVLNAIEKLIEKSFDSRARHGGAAGGYGSGPVGSAPMGSSILKRLGIDESVDYTKPLVDPQTMNILRSYHHHHHNQHHYGGRRERSGSESSSVSDRGGGGRPEALTPDRKPLESSSDRLLSSTPRTTPEKRIQTPPSASKVSSSHEESADDDTIKKEVEDDKEDSSTRRCNSNNSSRRDVIVKKEEVDEGDDDEDDRASYHSSGGRRRMDDVPLTPASGGTTVRDEEEAEEGTEPGNSGSGGGRRSSGSAAPSPVLSPRQATSTPSVVAGGDGAVPSSPCRNSTSSPASSDRSTGTPRSTPGGGEKKSSLGALSSMFDSLSGGTGSGAGGPGDSGSGAGGRGTSSHPLAALQKLCDKTERHGGSSRSASGAAGGGNHSSSSGAVASSSVQGGATGSASGAGSGGGTTPGAILAFSWACNDAVMTADSIMKCAFCDTPFISKGAYRHHLSKMHFVKDGVIPDPVALKAQQQSQQAQQLGASPGSSKGASNSGAPAAVVAVPSGSGSSGPNKSPQQQANFEESPHSKFLKYTELAKQLSSKYV